MKHWTEQRIYVYLALFFGLLFIFITPPFQSPDEDSHFKRSYQISIGKFYPVEKNKRLGNYFPKEMINYIDKKLSMMGKIKEKYSYSTFLEEKNNTMDYEPKVFNEYSTKNEIPIVYMAPALGIVFSKIVAHIFNMKMISTSFMLYFARLFSLIASIIVTAFAIKITPIRKKTFLTVGLLPMLLFLSSMVSYDNILNASLLLGLAIILNITYKKEKIENKDLIILGIIGTILLNIKTVYFLIFLLMLAVDFYKFGQKKDKIKKGAILLGGIIILTLIIKFPYFFLDGSGVKTDYIGKQISFILNNPFYYIKILLINIVGQRSFQLSSMIGLFGLLDVSIPVSITFIICINLIVIALSEGITEKIKITNLSKILIVIYIIISIIGIFTALYITWTPQIFNQIGTREITGVQGRYFIPLILPFLLLLSFNSKKERKIWKVIQDNYLLIPIIALTISIGSILLRFWI